MNITPQRTFREPTPCREEPKAERAIPAAFSVLQKNIRDLHEHVAMLDKRLEEVCECAPPAPDVDKRPVGAGLLGALHDSNYTVEVIIGDVKSILQRLHL